jgi:DnaJ-domain-containing protein 1
MADDDAWQPFKVLWPLGPFGVAVGFMFRQLSTAAGTESSNSHGDPKAEEPKNRSRSTAPLSFDQATLLLGLGRTFSAEELKTAWKRNVSEWHPDKLDGMADELRIFATRRVQSLNEAYALLRE